VNKLSASKHIGFIVLCATGLFVLSACSQRSGNGPTAIPEHGERGWVAWSKNPNPIYEGQYGLDGDPSVIKDGSIYRMFFTCYDPDKGSVAAGPALCQATSPDGFSWNRIYTSLDSQVGGKLIDTGLVGEWDEAHETGFILKTASDYKLYFTGHAERGDFFNAFPVPLGVATSVDGIRFHKKDAPIIQNTPTWYDSDAITSPSIVEDQGVYYMVYAAWCFSSCNNPAGIVLVGATSTDGINWTKESEPVLSASEQYPWMAKYVAEPELIKGLDGYFYLFVSGIAQDERMSIGVMRSQKPFGPWEVNPNPILTSTPGQFDAEDIAAPSVLVENGKIRMWFAGFNDSDHIQIGYAQASWPIYKP
jgi:beta-xylosidase